VTPEFNLSPSLEAIGSVKEQEENVGSPLVPFLLPEEHRRLPPTSPSSALVALSMSAASAACRFPEVGATDPPRLPDPVEQNPVGNRAP
jgi:hypothetical protein